MHYLYFLYTLKKRSIVIIRILLRNITMSLLSSLSLSWPFDLLFFFFYLLYSIQIIFYMKHIFITVRLRHSPLCTYRVHFISLFCLVLYYIFQCSVFDDNFFLLYCFVYCNLIVILCSYNELADCTKYKFDFTGN